MYNEILVFILHTYAQNLVANPSFEIYSICPNNYSQIGFSTGWYTPTNGSPDYYNVCQTAPFNFGVPENPWGFQYAHTGVAYSGIITFGAYPPPLREYIQSQLTDTLQMGKRYCIKFYINLSTISNTAITQIGAYLSKIPITIANSLPLSVNPQIVSPTGYYLSDTVNWSAISGTYIAQGGEKYITIGNFKDEITTDTLHWGIFSPASYYYIDDVSITECDTTTTTIPTSSIMIPNIFTPNNDRTNDVFSITTENIKELELEIYNRWGTLVWSSSPWGRLGGGWDGRTTAGLECTNGVYYYVLTATGLDEKKYKEKGFVQLVR